MTRSAVFLVVLLAAVSPAVESVVHARGRAHELPRLRPLDAETRAMVQAGFAQSPSLRALAAGLERTDVVVYLRAARLPQRMDGQLTFLSAAAGLRYVMVEIAWERSDVRRISTFGHELQHALEIAARPDIVSPDSMARAFADFGFLREGQRTGWQAFDTVAAMDAGERIWRELTGAAAADD